MRTNGLSRNSQTHPAINFINAQLPLPWVLRRSWSQVADHHRKKTPEFIWHKRTRSWTRPKWLRAETLTRSQFARVASSFSAVSPASNASARLKNTTSGKISGTRWHQWKTRGTTWVRARLLTSTSTPSVASSAAPSRRSTTLLRCMRLTRTSGRCWPSEWRIRCGLAALWPSLTVKFFSSVVRTPIGTARCTCLMWTLKTGSPSTTWTSFVWATSRSSFKTKSTLLAATTICRARCTTSGRTSGASSHLIILFSAIHSTHSARPSPSQTERRHQMVNIIESQSLSNTCTKRRTFNSKFFQLKLRSGASFKIRLPVITERTNQYGTKVYCINGKVKRNWASCTYY